ncbi:hypothetical protein PanWU01x14_114220 [Parasponia andersonii]|uniref:Uncharacterized protein n=1 Tax=Parasponia andersonii TaxID=3476 RepID=A0A2P5CXA3_PARAD|nr:hypothetical protein PanWU01x14_114220 [Parasponia andersonii]
MDPMPPINKVFSLMSQEERQRKVGIPLSDSTNTVAFATRLIVTKNSNLQYGTINNGGNRGNSNSGGYCEQTKEKPFCTHCQFHGHNIDHYYKLHGYPPGYQPRQQMPLFLRTIQLLLIRSSINFQLNLVPVPQMLLKLQVLEASYKI